MGLMIAVGTAAGQNTQAQTTNAKSRVEQIQEQQAEKAARLQPDEPTPVEQEFVKSQDVAGRLFKGSARLEVDGALPQGAGLSLGPVLEYNSASRNFVLRWSAIGSTRAFYSSSIAAGAPHIAKGRVAISGDAGHLDAPQLDYYGPGPDSLESGRTTYREEDTHFDFHLRWSPYRHRFSNGMRLGLLLVNVGPGTRHEFPASDAVYTPEQAPGVDVQSDFFRAGYWLEFDARDVPGNPHAGTRLSAGFDHYTDLRKSRFSFGRFSADAEQLIPFFNQKRVIALHGATELSFSGSGQVVPFYLQPYLGGSHDLRGFNRYRFRDDNTLVFNAEYRWEISTGFDFVLFGDAGRVFHRPEDISLSHLQTDAGFGFRFKARDKLFLSLDTGFSREGAHVWFGLQNVF